MSSPKELVWTDEHINHFWNYMSQKPNVDQKYFTYQNGVGIVNFLKSFTPVKGNSILDYGCGKGFLVNNLLSEGGIVSGLDYSEESVGVVNEKFKNRENWKGCILGAGEKLPYQDNSFDVIVCIETIEHVSDKYLLNMFKELFRILKNDGVFLITTPNNEQLEENFVYCPNCNHAFHRMQHIRTWNKNSLSKYAAQVNFRTVFIDSLNFKSFNRNPVAVKSIFDLSLRKIFQLIEYSFFTLSGRKRQLKFLLKKYNNRKHLAAVFTK